MDMGFSRFLDFCDCVRVREKGCYRENDRWITRDDIRDRLSIHEFYRRSVDGFFKLLPPL